MRTAARDARNNPFPDKPVAYVKVETALRPEVPIVLGVTLGVV